MTDDEFERLISEDDDDTEINLICPVCQGKNFEKTEIHGRDYLYWRKALKPIRFAQALNKLMGAKPVTSYRCLHCDYLLLFGHKD